MSTDQNKAVARRFQEEFNARNWEGCRSLLAPDCRSYQPGVPGPLNNDQFAGVGQMFAAAFPDLAVTIDEQVAEGEQVVSRLHFAGTHRHDFQGIPGTGKAISLEGYILDRISDGKIVEHRAMFDTLTLLQQLGVIPTPDQADSPVATAGG
jgi:steroid delta-isomerase-like uncharacterized protein